MDNTTGATMASLIDQLDERLARGKVQPEDTDTRLRLLTPLEKAIRDSPEESARMGASPAARIARLLWFKQNPKRIDVPFVLEQLRDDDPLVRTTAAEALLAGTNREGSSAADVAKIRPARAAVAEQRALETSPVIALQLDQLLAAAIKVSRPRRQTKRQIAPNPYVAGPVIQRDEPFFGREHILEEIGRAIGSGIKSVVLYGARRSGKTSLLYRIRDGAFGEDFLAVYLDMQAYSGRPIGQVVRDLIEAVRESAAKSKFGPVPRGQPLPQSSALFEILRDALQSCLDHIVPASLLLMFDEYEVTKEFIGSDAVVHQIESLREHERRLSFLFAGSQKVEHLNEKNFRVLLDSAKYWKISFLDPTDSRRLITEPARKTLTYSPDVIQDIQELCGGHPFYTQMLCHDLYELAAAEGTVTGSHLEQAVQSFLENPAPHLILGWNALKLQEKLVTAAVAEVQTPANKWVDADAIVQHLRNIRYPIRLEISEIQQTLGALREFEWLTKHKTDRSFRLSLGLVRRWVADHRSVWEVLDEYGNTLVKHTASIGQRSVAVLIDCVVLVTCLFLPIPQALAFDWSAAVVIGYNLVLIAAFGRTAGMFLARNRVVSESGVRPRLHAAALFSILRSSPLAMLFAALALNEHEQQVAAAVAAVAGLILTLIQAATIHFRKSGRGLFDTLAKIVVIRPLPVQRA